MSDYLDPNNEELLQDFFSEAEMQVEMLESNILLLENDPSSKEAIDEIFRAAHTLKGGAATVQMAELATFTHLLEDVLDLIRSDKLNVNIDITDILLRSIDVIKAMLSSRMEGNIYEDDITELIDSLKQLLKGDNSKVSSQKKKTTSDEEFLDKNQNLSEKNSNENEDSQEGNEKSSRLSNADKFQLSEYDLFELKETSGKSMKVYEVIAHIDTDDPMASVGGIQIFTLLKELSTVLKTFPSFDDLLGDEVFSRISYYVHFYEYDRERVIDKLSIGGIVKSVEIDEVDFSSIENLSQDDVLAKENLEEKLVVEEDFSLEKSKNSSAVSQNEKDIGKQKLINKKPPSASNLGGSSASHVLRIDNRRIDQILNLISETVINRSSINQINLKMIEMQDFFVKLNATDARTADRIISSLPEYIRENPDMDDLHIIQEKIGKEFFTLAQDFHKYEAEMKENLAHFKITTQSLSRNITELHESVLRVRMVPVSNLFSRFTRVVRDISKKLDKKVNLVFEGEETELDKSVVDELNDPLMHCVRNSMDHGLENVEQRKKSGKAESGTILLRAANEGNQIIIEIIDDGRGVDPKVIRNKAIERGIISAEKQMEDQEIINLIFEPGFSTASQVTDLSGRGVGLDVVKQNIEKLNGAVSVQSVLGEGSRFIIRLPLTLAIVQALLVQVQKEIYAISLNSVLESQRLRKSQIKVVDGYESFDFRDRVVSLIRLSDIFNLPSIDNKDYYFVVIVGTNERHIGLVVDSLVGEEDVVIKPLKNRYIQTQGVGGATLLGDGKVSLILDVNEIIDLGLKVGETLRK